MSVNNALGTRDTMWRSLCYCVRKRTNVYQLRHPFNKIKHKAKTSSHSSLPIAKILFKTIQVLKTFLSISENLLQLTQKVINPQSAFAVSASQLSVVTEGATTQSSPIKLFTGMISTSAVLHFAKHVDKCTCHCIKYSSWGYCCLV